MQAYLAEKYLSGAKGDAIRQRSAVKKKRKLNPDASGSGSIRLVVEDSLGGWEKADAEDEHDGAISRSPSVCSLLVC